MESEREMMVMIWKLLEARRAERISVPIVPLAWKGFVLLGKCCGTFVQQWGIRAHTSESDVFDVVGGGGHGGVLRCCDNSSSVG